MYIKKADERILIQILRGFAIILVVIHHVMKCFQLSNEANTLLTIINSVHVVVFFVISGWLFEKKRSKYKSQGMIKFIKSKFFQLLIPYFAFSFSFAILVVIGSRIDKLEKLVYSFTNGNIKSLPQIFFDIVFYHDVYYESLWFIYTLFILMILNYFMSSDLFSSAPFVGCMLVVAIFIKSYMWMIYDLEQITILNNVIMYLPWMLLGRFFYTKLCNGFILNIKIIVCAGCALLLCIIRYYYIDLAYFMGLYARAIWKGIEVFVIRISFLIIILAISKYLMERNRYRIISYIGDNSYDIYLIHNPWIVSVLAIFITKFFCASLLLQISICTMSSIILSIVLTRLIERYARPVYRLYFGKIGSKK